jgi:hypothetical protein
VILPGKPTLQFYLCSNKFELSQLDKSAFKPNWPLLSLLAFSVAIHIFVNVKIKILKAKQKHSFDVLTFSDQMKLGDIVSIDKQTMSDFLTNFLNVIAASPFFITAFLINQRNPIEFNKVKTLRN